MKNQVQLITYVDRLGGGDLTTLTEILQAEFAGLFGGVHVLPFFYPIDGADAGFDPIDHTVIDPRLGGWADLRRLAGTADVMADLIVNHISSDSPQFRDFVAKGSESEFADLFLTMNKVFPEGMTESQLAAIYRPPPGLPFTLMTLANGERRALWTTFTSKQIDIDVKSLAGRRYLTNILNCFAENGISMIRLDAVGYSVKVAGTSCFMLPQTFDFIEELTQQARELGMQVLVEIHSYFRDQIEIASRVDRVYDFALPPLLLHSLAFRTTKALKHWIEIRPTNSINVLDTHDGIGIIDIGEDATDPMIRKGLVPQKELDQLVELIHSRTGGDSERASGAGAQNLDLYQVNCTFYDAMGRDDGDYLAARAVQLFLPGIPQIYYVGLLAGHNDTALLEKTRGGRDINRHYYSRDEIREHLARPVVRGLIELIRLRNTHPAFAGIFRMEPSRDDQLTVTWENGRHFAQLQLMLEERSCTVTLSTHDGSRRIQLDVYDPSIGARPWADCPGSETGASCIA